MGSDIPSVQKALTQIDVRVESEIAQLIKGTVTSDPALTEGSFTLE